MPGPRILERAQIDIQRRAFPTGQSVLAAPRERERRLRFRIGGALPPISNVLTIIDREFGLLAVGVVEHQPGNRGPIGHLARRAVEQMESSALFVERQSIYAVR